MPAKAFVDLLALILEKFRFSSRILAGIGLKKPPLSWQPAGKEIRGYCSSIRLWNCCSNAFTYFQISIHFWSVRFRKRMQGSCSTEVKEPNCCKIPSTTTCADLTQVKMAVVFWPSDRLKLSKRFFGMRHAQATCAMISHQRWPMTNMNLLLRFLLGVDPATSNFSPKCWRCFPLLVSSKHFFKFGPWFLLSTISKNTSGCPVKFKIQHGRQRKTAVGLWGLWCFVG